MALVSPSESSGIEARPSRILSSYSGSAAFDWGIRTSTAGTVRPGLGGAGWSEGEGRDGEEGDRGAQGRDGAVDHGGQSIGRIVTPDLPAAGGRGPGGRVG